MLNEKSLQSVAEAVKKVWAEELKGNQHKIDKNKNNKIDSEDLKMLRKEESEEQVQEGWDDMLKSVKEKNGPQPSGGSGVKQGSRYGGGKQKDTPEQDEDKPKAKKKAKGAFSEMLNTYQEGGLKTIAEAWAKKKVMKEEPDNEQFTKELEKQKRKAAGTASEEEKAKVAAPASQGCVAVKEETEQLDELSKDTLNSYVGAAKQDNKDHADSRRSGDQDEAKWAKDRMVKRSTGIGAAQNRLKKEEVEELDERKLSASETEKKEDIVHGMKKNIAGFKQRYGDRAKSVMYATATKNAKGE